MSIFTITPNYVETTSFITQVERTVVSSSAGVTGSVHLTARPTSFLKEISTKTDGFAATGETDILVEASAVYSASEAQGSSANIYSRIEDYLGYVHSSSVVPRNSVTFSPVRYTQPTSGSGTVERKYFMKRVINNNLMPAKRVEYNSSDFSYGNYHCLNFFSNSNVESKSAIIYANTENPDGTRVYSPTGPFSLDFHIKPTCQTAAGSPYNAGTIFHLSSSICVSLVTGSNKTANNTPGGFRVLLQLSQSADTNPKNINLNSLPAAYPNNLVFLSDDNTLTLNAWHHVSIRWGTSAASDGKGSIIIDNAVSDFYIPSSSITTLLNSYALVLGNYFDGTSNNALFFNTDIATTEGIPNVIASSATPDSFGFNNPLQAELHHISFYDRFISTEEISTGSIIDMSSSLAPVFFVGPVFNPSTTELSTLRYPTTTFVTSTDSPVSFENALGVNGFYLNLQNFVKDYGAETQPRLFNLTGSATPYVSNQTANQMLLSQSNIRKRNLTILPCDDGNMNSPLELIEFSSSRFFENDLGINDVSIISMKQLAPPAAYISVISDSAFIDLDDNMMTLLPSTYYLPVLQVINRGSVYPDLSSNLVTIIEFNSLYYGSRIVPGSFTLSDDDYFESGGLSFTLKDDGAGGLYRSNCTTTVAKNNKVGNIFYEQGLVIILSPHMYLFGLNSFTASFRGEHKKFIKSISVMAEQGSINLSRNSSFKKFSPTQSLTETDNEFVYITGVNLHDKNFNVVMRAKLAQPVQKRDSDEFMFRLRYDF